MALFNMAFDGLDDVFSEQAAYITNRGVMPIRRWNFPDGEYIEFSSKLPLNRAVGLANMYLVRRFACKGECVNSQDYDITGKFTMFFLDPELE